MYNRRVLVFPAGGLLNLLTTLLPVLEARQNSRLNFSSVLHFSPVPLVITCNSQGCIPARQNARRPVPFYRATHPVLAGIAKFNPLDIFRYKLSVFH
ncbi:MAG: hypothetical protein LBR26_00905 [Prevotella sp.]|nr:hypothetical protein [Prevotella sp.]